MVGKYMDLLDAYKSLSEALTHAGIHTSTAVDIDFVDSTRVEEEGLRYWPVRMRFWFPEGLAAEGLKEKSRLLLTHVSSTYLTWGFAMDCTPPSLILRETALI